MRVDPGAYRSPAWAIGFGCAFIFIIYNIIYLTYSPVPGNSAEYPLGWWGWFDQSQYLKGAKAILNGDFSPSQHFYPPLYPFLGSLFLRLSESHVYYLPNLALALGYYTLFVLLFGRYVGWWVSATCGLVGMFLYEPFRLQWVIPWTTTLGAFLIVCALFLLDRYIRRRDQNAWTTRAATANAALFGFAVGLQAPLRPADLAFVAPIAVIYAVLVAQAFLTADGAGRRSALAIMVCGLVGFSIPVGLMLLFNSVTYGSVTGGYFHTVTTIGLDPRMLPDRLFSHLLASQVFFGEQDADWLSVIPLVFAATVFLPIALFTGPMVMRAAAAAACVQFAIYFSYSDLIPTGTFRYFNIHYFKWLAPVALCILFYFVRRSLSREPTERREGRTALAAGLALGFVITSIDAGQELKTVKHFMQQGQRVTVDLGGSVDFVDFVGIGEDWPDIFNPGGTTVIVDDSRTLTAVTNYRFLPIQGGVRLLIFEPMRGGRLTVEFGEARSVPQVITAAEVLPVDVVYELNLPFAQQASPAQPSMPTSK